MLALATDFLVTLQRANWNIGDLEFQPEVFTLLLPLLVFAWQTVSDHQTAAVMAAADRLSQELSQLPTSIRAEMSAEVDSLRVDNEEFRRQLARGVVEHERHYYRTLTYQRDEGSLFNGFGDAKDVSRNVLFSNKTINLILAEVRDIERNNDALLHGIGKKASGRFAAEMVSDIQKQARDSDFDLTDWLELWIEFDSDAGFGKFELENKDDWQVSRVILLKYSFLTQYAIEDKKRDFGLCHFMTGYLEGILNSFPPTVLSPYELRPGSVRISHDVNDDDQCIWAGRPQHLGCRFHLS